MGRNRPSRRFDATVSVHPGAAHHGPANAPWPPWSQTPWPSAELGKTEEGQPVPAPAVAVDPSRYGRGQILGLQRPGHRPGVGAWHAGGLISTATVALQEQLVHKDLPALAAQLPTPFRYALAKGRGRFVCKLKLERLASSHAQEEIEDLLGDLAPVPAPISSAQQQVRLKLYTSMADALARSVWDGDRDSLETPPEPEVWGPIAAEGSSAPGATAPLLATAATLSAARSWSPPR